MTASNSRSSSIRAKAGIWLIFGSAVLLLIAANWHLVYVATTSEPGCVAHVRRGENPPQSGQFSAAESSCSPR